MKEPNIFVLQQLARAIESFLLASGQLPENKTVMLGEGDIDTDTQTLTIKYMLGDPPTDEEWDENLDWEDEDD